MNVTPIGDRVLVLPARAATRSAGGILVSAKPQMEPEQGVVVAKGRDATSEVYVGQRVVYAKGKHQVARVDGHDLVVLHDTDLIAVVED